MSNAKHPFNPVAMSLCTQHNTVHFIASMPFHIYNYNLGWARIYQHHIIDEKTEEELNNCLRLHVW